MNITPSISVITCLYNCPPELFEKCIKGLISQTFKNFEVLIVNDGSTKYLDDNKKIIEKYTSVIIAQELIENPFPVAVNTLLGMEVK